MNAALNVLCQSSVNTPVRHHSPRERSSVAKNCTFSLLHRRRGGADCLSVHRKVRSTRTPADRCKPVSSRQTFTWLQGQVAACQAARAQELRQEQAARSRSRRRTTIPTPRLSRGNRAAVSCRSLCTLQAGREPLYLAFWHTNRLSLKLRPDHAVRTVRRLCRGRQLRSNLYRHPQDGRQEYVGAVNAHADWRHECR